MKSTPEEKAANRAKAKADRDAAKKRMRPAYLRSNGAKGILRFDAGDDFMRFVPNGATDERATAFFNLFDPLELAHFIGAMTDRYNALVKKQNEAVSGIPLAAVVACDPAGDKADASL